LRAQLGLAGDDIVAKATATDVESGQADGSIIFSLYTLQKLNIM
jgi:hypothetical protein